MLNLIKQVVYHAVTKVLDVAVIKALNQRLEPDRCRPVFVNKDLLGNVENIHKDWKPEEIGFFGPDCEESSLVIIPNCHGYYRDIYAFINRLKEVAVFQSMKKTQDVLPQLLRGSVLVWYSTTFPAIEEEIPRIIPSDYCYKCFITRFKCS